MEMTLQMSMLLTLAGFALCGLAGWVAYEADSGWDIYRRRSLRLRLFLWVLSAVLAVAGLTISMLWIPGRPF